MREYRIRSSGRLPGHVSGRRKLGAQTETPPSGIEAGSKRSHQKAREETQHDNGSIIANGNRGEESTDTSQGILGRRRWKAR